MIFEKDKQTGSILVGCIIAYGAFILVALVIGVKSYYETPPRYLLVALLAVTAIYMIVYLLRFIRLYRLWKNAFLEMGEDQVCGFGADEKLRHGKRFEIPSQSLEDVSLTTVFMTRKTPLNALKLKANGETRLIIGLEIDEQLKEELRKADEKY